MQNSKLNLRAIDPAHALETPAELAARYGLPLAASYRAAMQFAIHLPISAMPRGVADTASV